MLQLPIWFIFSAALGAVSVWACQRLAVRWNWLDHPNERSFHEKPTPRIGGIGILVPLLVTALGLILLPQISIGWVIAASLGPALIIALLSFFDDRFDLSRGIRFSGHVICALFVLYVFRSYWIGQPLPLVGTVFPAFICGILFVVWVAGLTNSFNFMDGIDGIAGIQGLIAIAGWLGIFFLDTRLDLPNGDVQSLLLLSLAGGLVGFLLLNWSPASIFMGDIGSTFLGFYLAVLPFAFAAFGLPLQRALEAGVLFVWPFVIDTAIAFVRRVIRRERIFEAHRSHLYQVLAGTFPSRESGHRLTSLLFGALALLGVGLYWNDGPLWAKLAVLGGIWVAVAAWTYGIRLKEAAESLTSDSTVAVGGPENGGSTADLMSYDIFLSPPEITEVERIRVMEALASGFIAPVGPQVNAFEKGIADYLGLDEVQSVNSGTAAIHLGLRALGVGPGDCVLCPNLTFVASVNPVRYLGAEPVLVDVSPENWAMDPDVAREAIQTLKAEGRTVRAMVVVHAFGIPAPIDKLAELAREEGVLVLEDCAGAFGATFGGKAVGAYGDAATYSFNGNKVLTTSGGGALYVRDSSMRESARVWANQGKHPQAVGYRHDTMGYNYRLSNICAAIGLGQLETVNARLARKKAIFQQYQQQLSGLAGVGFMPQPDYGTCNYWLSCISINGYENVEAIVVAMRDAGIEASPMWRPMDQQGVNQGLRSFGGESSQLIHESFLSLPSGSSMTDEQVQRVVDCVRGQLPVAT
ncbi:MAG: aminotransferase class V-fold PLP-dependent enzyme [Puniceicoccaceae bacterium]